MSSSPIMRDIMTDVGIPMNQLQRITWIITMYLLGYIAAMPLLGSASDRFGRKLVLQASLACSSSVRWSPPWPVHWGDFHHDCRGRTIQGVASGALLPVTLALGADLWAQRNRAGVLGGIGAAQELGSVLGPLYGIFIVLLFHDWRYVFWINVPLTLHRHGDDPVQPAVARTRSSSPKRSTWPVVCYWRSPWALR